MYNHEFQAYQNKELKTFKAENKIEINLQKYIISGVALIDTWTDHTVAYLMTPFEIQADDFTTKEAFMKDIRERINDGGFGAKSILGAYIVITACYYHPIMCGSAHFELSDEFIGINNYEITDKDKDFLLESWSTY